MQFWAANFALATWMPWRDGTLGSIVPTRTRVRTFSAVEQRPINTAAPKRIKSYSRKFKSKEYGKGCFGYKFGITILLRYCSGGGGGTTYVVPTKRQKRLQQ